ncbi:MAG: HAD family acid phosphatase [Enhygromyxa sp.]
MTVRARLSLAVLGCVLAGPLACRFAEADELDRAALEQRLATLEAENHRLAQELETERGCRGQVIDSLTAFAQGPYSEVTRASAAEALALLEARVAAREGDEKLAIVLDVDETALSNIEQLRGSGYCFVREEWNEWVDQGTPTAIAGIRPLYDYAREHGVAVVFLTGRSEDQREATERALRAAGFDHWDHLLLREGAERGLKAAEYKSGRRAKLEAQGYVVALVLGDQQSDLDGGHGEHSMLIPNPFYHVK